MENRKAEEPVLNDRKLQGLSAPLSKLERSYLMYKRQEFGGNAPFKCALGRSKMLHTLTQFLLMEGDRSILEPGMWPRKDRSGQEMAVGGSKLWKERGWSRRNGEREDVRY